MKHDHVPEEVRLRLWPHSTNADALINLCGQCMILNEVRTTPLEGRIEAHFVTRRCSSSEPVVTLRDAAQSVFPKGALPRGTPERVLKAWREMTDGYSMQPEQILAKRFAADADEIVAVRNVRFTSLCEHHLLPFTGETSVAYLPGKKEVVGLSKLARLVACFARRLQLQERMTKQIADAIEQYLQPRGVCVMVRGTHACMACRGVTQPDSDCVTTAMRGVFRENQAARAEVLAILKQT